MLILIYYLLLLQLTTQITLLRSLQPCPQILTVQQVQLLGQDAREVALFCGNDVDRDEPIRIYDLVGNRTRVISKEKSQLVSGFFWDGASGYLSVGDSNSTVSVYNLHNLTLNSTYKTPQPNTITTSTSLWPQKHSLLWTSNNGQLCLTSLLRTRTACQLAHAFTASALTIDRESGTAVTCGGDRLCKLWRVQGADQKLVLGRSYMLARVSKVSNVLVSGRRIVVGGLDGTEMINLLTEGDEDARVSMANTGMVCGKLIEEWDTMLSVTPEGNLLITELLTGSVTKYPFTQKVTSCSFFNMTMLVTGHGQGYVKIWKI